MIGRWAFLPCCDNPDIQHSEGYTTLENTIYCNNCKLWLVYLDGNYNDIEIPTKWNEMIKERDKKRRDIADVALDEKLKQRLEDAATFQLSQLNPKKADINIYPFVFAMK